MPFVIYEFRENWHNESQAFLRGLAELVSILLYLWPDMREISM